MNNTPDATFLTLVIVMAVIGAGLLLRAGLIRRTLGQEAADDWDYKVINAMEDQAVTREDYIQIYTRLNAPRAGGYLGMTLVVIAALTPVAFGFASLALEGIYRLSGREEAFLPGFLLWQFILFFMIVGFWAAIAAIAARRYHKKAPETYRREVEKFKTAQANGYRY